MRLKMFFLWEIISCSALWENVNWDFLGVFTYRDSNNRYPSWEAMKMVKLAQ